MHNRAMPRDLFSQPLFSPRLLERRFPAQPIPEAHLELITQWRDQLRGAMGSEKEVTVRPVFLQRFFHDILGYHFIGTGSQWTLEHEGSTIAGSADAVLGNFSEGARQTVAPFELKGPKTANLDALMPGRNKSPAQQAWEYANDLPGTQFVLVSNCDEVRLYAFGHGRATYESWHVADLLDEARYASFVGLLHANRFVTGQTLALLAENALQEREITQKLYADYKTLRQELILGLHHLNPAIDFATLVRHAQKLIDRLLFIAFAESRELLPKGSIKHAAEHIDPYNPQPRWNNFVALFKAVDSGNPFLKIPPYNGGLFAPDAALDALQVSDALVKSFTRLSGYDYADEVSVTVLGRIFEQSITDLERIAQAGNIEQFRLEAHDAPAATGGGVQGKRKRDGVVYTPDHITRFIVEQTLTPTIVARFQALQRQYLADDGAEWRKPTTDEKKHAAPSVAPENITEHRFWLAWQDELTHIRALDPACGSGAFLVAAFDVFKEAYTQLYLRLRELAPQELFTFDISHQILERNLFGVDINAESIEITKLSLWLKTAERDRQLAGLDANFYQGNSLIEDEEADPLALRWHDKFAAVLADGGFDVVIGNPPYVRQELFSALKPALQQHYRAYHGVADLYVYFYELGLRLLRSGGRLGYISSSSFFKTSSGEPLRRLLRTASQIEVLVDFGDWQVFEGVTTYPAIVVARKLADDKAPPASATARFLQLGEPVQDLNALFSDQAQTLLLAQLGPAAPFAKASEPAPPPMPEWQLEGKADAALRAKLTQGHRSLKEVVGSPYRGLLTGLNEAFIISRAQRDQLVQADPACAKLIKPFLRGDDIERWRVESQDAWLILLPKGWTRLHMLLVAEAEPPNESSAWDWLTQQHPALAQWLAPFAEAARKRTDQGDYWWELRACAYYDAFEQPKVLYPDICVRPCFMYDAQGHFCGNTGYFLPVNSLWLTALLNSSAMWLLIVGMSTHIRGGYRRMFTQHIETLPIPNASADQQAKLAALAQQAQNQASARLKQQQDFARRILDLLPKPPPKGAQTTLSEKLKEWWLLPDFSAFQHEVAKRFKAEIPLRERNDWEQWFGQAQADIHQHSAAISEAERRIDTLVAELFALTPEEQTRIARAVRH